LFSPDKNPDGKSKERFARLGVINNFFLKNGVPRWRGTGYYYELMNGTNSD
jgi:hypothetical protein